MYFKSGLLFFLVVIRIVSASALYKIISVLHTVFTVQQSMCRMYTCINCLGGGKGALLSSMCVGMLAQFFCHF